MHTHTQKILTFLRKAMASGQSAKDRPVLQNGALIPMGENMIAVSSNGKVLHAVTLERHKTAAVELQAMTNHAGMFPLANKIYGTAYPDILHVLGDFNLHFTIDRDVLMNAVNVAIPISDSDTIFIAVHNDQVFIGANGVHGTAQTLVASSNMNMRVNGTNAVNYRHIKVALQSMDKGEMTVHTTTKKVMIVGKVNGYTAQAVSYVVEPDTPFTPTITGQPALKKGYQPRRASPPKTWENTLSKTFMDNADVIERAKNGEVIRVKVHAMHWKPILLPPTTRLARTASHTMLYEIKRDLKEYGTQVPNLQWDQETCSLIIPQFERTVCWQFGEVASRGIYTDSRANLEYTHVYTQNKFGLRDILEVL